MENKTVNHLANKYKGKINVTDIISELKNQGYSTVFFNTPEGDEILKAYNISVNDTKAFTYCGATRIVFADNDLHTNDKIYSLLHELGHIALGHIGNGDINLKDKRKTENEAEAFAYAVLNPPSKINKTTLLSASVLALGVLSAIKILQNRGENRCAMK